MPMMIGSGFSQPLGAAPSHSWTTVLDLDMESAGDGGWGGGNYTVVAVIPAAELGAATGTWARATFTWVAFASSATAQFYMGQQAASGDAYDFLNTPALNQITFSSSPTITGDGSTLVYVSDPFQLPETYDNTKKMVVAVQFNGSTITISSDASPTHTGAATYYNSGLDARTANKSSYFANNTGSVEILSKLEISAT